MKISGTVIGNGIIHVLNLQNSASLLKTSQCKKPVRSKQTRCRDDSVQHEVSDFIVVLRFDSIIVILPWMDLERRDDDGVEDPKCPSDIGGGGGGDGDLVEVRSSVVRRRR